MNQSLVFSNDIFHWASTLGCVVEVTNKGIVFGVSYPTGREGRAPDIRTSYIDGWKVRVEALSEDGEALLDLLR